MYTNLVIGSEGFVGKPFSLFLEELGEKVIRFDIKRGESEDARSVRLKLDNVDRVYFLAWEVGGAKYLYRQDTQFLQLDWNLRLLLNIMPQLQKSKTPFLFVSSQLAEECDTVYGVTKRLGEVWTHLLRGVRIRLWNIYGSLEQQTDCSHVVSDFVNQAVNNKEIRMLTTGEERRQFVHVDDVCKALHKAIDERLDGIYDITSFEWVKILDLAGILSDLTGANILRGDKIGSTPLTPMVGRIPGWLPEISLRDGLHRMVVLAQEKSCLLV